MSTVKTTFHWLGETAATRKSWMTDPSAQTGPALEPVGRADGYELQNVM